MAVINDDGTEEREKPRLQHLERELFNSNSVSEPSQRGVDELEKGDESDQVHSYAGHDGDREHRSEREGVECAVFNSEK